VTARARAVHHLESGRVSPEELAYRQRTTASLRFFQEARHYLPGGDSRSTLFYLPYPAVMERGEGCWVVDLDGNKLLDFTGNHSSLAHGYGHPAVMAAVRDQLNKGTCFPAPAEPQLHLARLICERIPSVELVRFTNSGTEATLNVMRAVREFTGRRRIAQIEGGYHGSLDETMEAEHPDVLVIPFDDANAAVRLIESERDRLGAVVVEPVQAAAGMVPAEREYMLALQEAARRLGILFVLDEVVSLRVAYGGAQEYYGVTPDLTILGKIIGGGLPLGAFGGRRDIMALFDPSEGPPRIPHPGSYNANPVSLAAGAATLELLTREAIASLNHRGDGLRHRMQRAFDRAGIPARITGLGSLFAIHLTARPVRSRRDAATADNSLRHRIYLGLYNEGVLIDPRGVGTISTAVGEEEISQFLHRLEAVLGRIAGH
jgi:glutamate-1-semialdehyde 2,1-aminomutase